MTKKVGKSACVIALVLALSVFSLRPCSFFAYAANAVAPADDGEKLIALTFDDGPHPYQTPRILEILEKHQIKASFFIIGVNALRYPEILQTVCARGHTICNHTFTHASMHKKSADEIERELRKTHAVISSLCGVKCRFFRPPEGAKSRALEEVCEKMGYSLVMWTLDTRDWSGASAKSIGECILSGVEGRSRSIVLCHDYIGSNAHTAQALESVIPTLLERGYRFVTIDEIM